MKRVFWAYRDKSKEEINRLFSDCIFIFDTNILLKFYRVSKKEAQNYLDVLLSYRKKLYLPFTVGQEFYKNRKKVIGEGQRDVKSIIDKYEDINTKIEKLLNAFGQIPKSNKKDTKDTLEKIKSIKKSFSNFLEETKKTRENELKDFIEKDWIEENLINIFDEKVLREYSKEDLEKEAEERYKNKIPPGFRDEGKECNKYGDYYIWYEIINLAKEKKKDIIFVTDDCKDDWYQVNQGKTNGPNPLLLLEFYKKTERYCHIMQFTSFMYYHNNMKHDQKSPTFQRNAIERWPKKELPSDDYLDKTSSNVSGINSSDIRTINNKMIKTKQFDFYIKHLEKRRERLLDKLARINSEDKLELTSSDIKERIEINQKIAVVTRDIKTANIELENLISDFADDYYEYVIRNK